MNDQKKKNSREINPASLAAITLFKRLIFLKPCLFTFLLFIAFCAISKSHALTMVVCCHLYRCVSRCGIFGSCQRGGLCRTGLQSRSYTQRSHHPKPLPSACGGVGAPRFQRSHPHQIWSVCSSCSSKLQG